MGSGLILFVIVGAWLAVLVPMGLRSHDDAAPSRSVERFGDAMRVLSRRTGQAADGAGDGEPRRVEDDDAVPRDDVPGHDVPGHDVPGHDVPGHDVPGHDLPLVAPGRLRGGALRALDAAVGARTTLTAHLPRHLPPLPSLRRRPGGSGSATAPAGRTIRTGRAGRTTPATTTVRTVGPVRGTAPVRSAAAVRRGRVLMALGLLAAAGLVAALVVPAALLLTALCAVLSVAFVVHCRRQARSRAAWLRNRATVEAELSGRPVHRAHGAQTPPRGAPAAASQRGAPAIGAGTRTAPAGPVQRHLDAARPDEQPAAVRTDQFFDLAAYERSTAVAPAAPAARTAVRAALGAEWQPVPVPLPMYVGKQTAPARPARSSALREQRQAHHVVLDDPGELQREVVERDRAAAGW